MEDRKKDHIDLSFQSQTPREALDSRFYYEPMLSAHPTDGLVPVQFLGKLFKAPLWVSSMTGGTQLAAKINRNLATACNDFDMRSIIGDDLPLYANLGICQVEQLLELKQEQKIIRMVEKLRADGLIVHVNPMQEWFQPEGDVLKYPAIDTIKRLLDKVNFPLIVKEVGQGIGPESMKALLKLPLAAVEFAAFGGTNFARVELLRDTNASKELFEPLSLIGTDVYQMLESVNRIVGSDEKIACRQIIISGGIKSFLDGYYLIKRSSIPAIYGQASSFLKYAREDYEKLQEYVSQQIKGLEIAHAFLRIRP
jgi:isopentenyl-diphosphate delta-isomerase